MLKSKAQQSKLFELEAAGKLKKGTAEEFAKATPDIKNLPERVKKSGGPIRSIQELRAIGEKKRKK